MNLRRIKIFMDDASHDREFVSVFNYHVFFIGYYLSRQLKKYKVATDGTYDSINIIVGQRDADVSVFDKTLNIPIVFDPNRYECVSETDRCNYYIDLLREGLRKASIVKPITMELFETMMAQLMASDFIYRWIFKSVPIKSYDIKVDFICELSTCDFTMFAEIKGVKNQQPFKCRVIRTKPDEVFFDCISKDIIVSDDFITFRSKWGTDLLSLPLYELRNGKCKLVFSPSPYPDDYKATNNFHQLQKELRYDNNDFI